MHTYTYYTINTPIIYIYIYIYIHTYIFYTHINRVKNTHLRRVQDEARALAEGRHSVEIVRRVYMCIDVYTHISLLLSSLLLLLIIMILIIMILLIIIYLF